MKILAIETSTPVCSVALLHEERLFQRINNASNRHAEVVLQMVDELLKESETKPSAIDLIAYSQGPGSFTGLRIASSMAQGLTLGWRCPTVGISSLWAIAKQVLNEDNHRTSCYVLADARQDEVYYGLYTYDQHQWTVDFADNLSRVRALPVPAKSCVFAGSACLVHKMALQHYFGETFSLVSENTIPYAESIAKIAKYQLVKNEISYKTLALPCYIRQRVTN